jgi:hypothetical protein
MWTSTERVQKMIKSATTREICLKRSQPSHRRIIFHHPALGAAVGSVTLGDFSANPIHVKDLESDWTLDYAASA